MSGLLIFIHFILITAIICFVLMQRSAESSVLVASNYFAPGGANRFLVKVTRILVIAFVINCMLMSYMKYGKTFNKVNDTNLQKTTTVPME